MKKLLVIDDEPAVRSLVSASLAGCDWEVTAVADGASAFAVIPNVAPDVILLDVGLPGMSGCAVLARLRAERPTASIPVLYLTGLEPEEGPRANGLVPKPFTPAILRDALAPWLV